MISGSEANQLIRSSATREVSLRAGLIVRGRNDAALLLRSHHLLQRAQAGDAEAQLQCGDMYHYGLEGEEPNLIEAMTWYRKAADQGNARAQYAVGRAYANGVGVSVDRREAIEWYQRSAKQRNKEAIIALAEIFDGGSLAKQIAVERPRCWEYSLIVELLRTQVLQLQRRYLALDTELLSEPTIYFKTISEYLRWMQEHVEALQGLAFELASCAPKVMSACGEPGEPGDPVEILKAVNKLVKVSESFIEWERITLLVEPPECLRRLRRWFRGSIENLVDVPRRMSADIARVINESQDGGVKEHSITLKLDLPVKQIESFLVELSRSGVG